MARHVLTPDQHLVGVFKTCCAAGRRLEYAIHLEVTGALHASAKVLAAAMADPLRMPLLARGD